MHCTDQRSVVGRKEAGLLHTSQAQLSRAPSQGPHKPPGCRPTPKQLRAGSIPAAAAAVKRAGPCGAGHLLVTAMHRFSLEAANQWTRKWHTQLTRVMLSTSWSPPAAALPSCRLLPPSSSSAGGQARGQLCCVACSITRWQAAFCLPQPSLQGGGVVGHAVVQRAAPLRQQAACCNPPVQQADRSAGQVPRFMQDHAADASQ